MTAGYVVANVIPLIFFFSLAWQRIWGIVGQKNVLIRRLDPKFRTVPSLISLLPTYLAR